MRLIEDVQILSWFITKVNRLALKTNKCETTTTVKREINGYGRIKGSKEKDSNFNILTFGSKFEYPNVYYESVDSHRQLFI